MIRSQLIVELTSFENRENRKIVLYEIFMILYTTKFSILALKDICDNQK